MRSFLALSIVVGSLAFIGVAWAIRGSAESERLAAILAGLLGSVSGYYFGSRGVERAQDRATRAVEQTARTRAGAAELDALTDDLAEQVLAEGQKAAMYAKLAGDYARVLEVLREDPPMKEKIEEVMQRLATGPDVGAGTGGRGAFSSDSAERGA